MTHELMAVARGDGVTACSLATPTGQARLAKSIPGATCRQVVSLLADRLSPAIKDGLGSAHVTRVTISGDTATVQDSDISSTRGSLAGLLQPGSPPTVLTKQPDGTWKISG
jgi:hypothetical protein